MNKSDWILLIENMNFNILLTFLIEKGYHFNLIFEDSIKIEVYQIFDITFSSKDSSYNTLIFLDDN